MTERTTMDRIRDLAAGRLDDVEAWRLRETDPDADALARAYLTVDRAFDAAMALSAGTEVAESAPRRRPRRLLVTVAAVVLLALGAAVTWLATRSPHETTVALRHVPLTAPVLTNASLPDTATATLASYSPVQGGAIQWLSSLEDARAISQATGRPVLLFVYHPTCPACVQLRKVSFKDAKVVDLVGGALVPVHVDVRTADPQLTGSLSGWPFLAALSPDGSTLREFPGYHDGAELSNEIRAALGEQSLALALTWDDARVLAIELEQARAAAVERRHADALRALARVQRADPRGLFGRAAEDAVSGIANAARARLLEARLRAADTGPEVAAAVLDHAAEEFRGTPFAEDFVRVRRHVERDRRFPHLVEARATRAM